MAVTGSKIAAFAKGTTWGTAASTNNAFDGMLLLDEPDFIAKPDSAADESQGFYYKQYIDATFLVQFTEAR